MIKLITRVEELLKEWGSEGADSNMLTQQLRNEEQAKNQANKLDIKHSSVSCVLSNLFETFVAKRSLTKSPSCYRYYLSEYAPADAINYSQYLELKQEKAKGKGEVVTRPYKDTAPFQTGLLSDLNETNETPEPTASVLGLMHSKPIGETVHATPTNKGDTFSFVQSSNGGDMEIQSQPGEYKFELGGMIFERKFVYTMQLTQVGAMPNEITKEVFDNMLAATAGQ